MDANFPHDGCTGKASHNQLHLQSLPTASQGQDYGRKESLSDMPSAARCRATSAKNDSSRRCRLPRLKRRRRHSEGPRAAPRCATRAQRVASDPTHRVLAFGHGSPHTIRLAAPLGASESCAAGEVDLRHGAGRDRPGGRPPSWYELERAEAGPVRARAAASLATSGFRRHSPAAPGPERAIGRASQVSDVQCRYRSSVRSKYLIHLLRF